MSLNELLDKIIDASEELGRQSIDYVKASSLISVLDKLVDCYNNKCKDATNKELDDACWYIIYANASTYSEKTISILGELYRSTVASIRQRIMDDEQLKENEIIKL